MYTFNDFIDMLCGVFPEVSDEIKQYSIDNTKDLSIGDPLYSVTVTGHHIEYYKNGEWYYVSERIEGRGYSFHEALKDHWENYNNTYNEDEEYDEWSDKRWILILSFLTDILLFY